VLVLGLPEITLRTRIDDSTERRPETKSRAATP
jgi:hypothetical protein